MYQLCPAVGGPPERVIGWIDNTIQKFLSFSDAFAENGSTVICASSGSEFLANSPEDEIDHLLLDYDFLGTTGFEILPEILVQQKVKGVYLCTAYSYQAHLRDAAERFHHQHGTSIELLPKETLPFADKAANIRTFLKELDSGLIGRPMFDIDDQRILDIVTEADFPSLEEYLEYDIDRRISLLSSGRRIFSALIEQEFQSGAMWIVIDPKRRIVVCRANDTRQIPSELDLIAFAKTHNFVPLTYAMGSTLDAIDNHCAPIGDLATYPAIGLAYSANDDTCRFEYIHFDNGNSQTLLAYEYFLELGWLSPLVSPVQLEIGGLTLFGKFETLDGATLVDSFGKSIIRDICGFFTILWNEHRFALQCHADCNKGTVYPTSNSYILCNRRKGLFGRNLGREVSAQFLIDMEDGSLRFWDK